MLKVLSKLVYSVNITFLQRFSTFWLRFKVFKLYRCCDKFKHHFQTLIESLIFVSEVWNLICRLIKPWGIQICYCFKYTMNNSTCVGICKFTFYLFWPILEGQIIPRNLVHDEKLFLFSHFHRGFVNISEEIRTLVVKHCVFSSGRPKSNKMLNKNKIKYFGPYKNWLILSNAALYLVH